MRNYKGPMSSLWEQAPPFPGDAWEFSDTRANKTEGEIIQGALIIKRRWQVEMW